jgi:hypothetical protein
MNTEDELLATCASLQKQIDDLKSQCDNLYKKLGYPSWESEKRQRADNAKSQGTRAPFSPSQHFGEVYRPKPHEQRQ